MLVNITVENFKSFDKKEELSMISSSKIQENKSHRIKIKQTNLLKNAVYMVRMLQENQTWLNHWSL